MDAINLSDISRVVRLTNSAKLMLWTRFNSAGESQPQRKMITFEAETRGFFFFTLSLSLLSTLCCVLARIFLILFVLFTSGP